jgi:hypothetical protein
LDASVVSEDICFIGSRESESNLRERFQKAGKREAKSQESRHVGVLLLLFWWRAAEPNGFAVVFFL